MLNKHVCVVYVIKDSVVGLEREAIIQCLMVPTAGEGNIDRQPEDLGMIEKRFPYIQWIRAEMKDKSTTRLD